MNGLLHHTTFEPVKKDRTQVILYGWCTVGESVNWATIIPKNHKLAEGIE